MKVKLYILQFLYVLFTIIEFLWSVLVSLFETVGLKLSELVDVVEANITKTKAKS
jgi:hypothetical protein